jgi:hypothetical protein
LAELGEAVRITSLSTHTWKLESEDPSLRQRVSQLALRHNLEVLELVSEQNSLESIFQKLTRHVDHP